MTEMNPKVIKEIITKLQTVLDQIETSRSNFHNVATELDTAINLLQQESAIDTVIEILPGSTYAIIFNSKVDIEYIDYTTSELCNNFSESRFIVLRKGDIQIQKLNLPKIHMCNSLDQFPKLTKRICNDFHFYNNASLSMFSDGNTFDRSKVTCTNCLRIMR